MKFKLLFSLLFTVISFVHAQAEQGDADAQYNLGYMFENGQDPQIIVENEGLMQMNNDDEINKMIEVIIENNEKDKFVSNYKSLGNYQEINNRDKILTKVDDINVEAPYV